MSQLKAKELAKILMRNPEATIQVGWEEQVTYSEYTSGSEDRIENIESVYFNGNSFVFSFECYLAMDKLWPEQKG